MSNDDRLFKLTDPHGNIIASGPMSAVMERLPDTHARNDAIDQATRAVLDAMAAEQRMQQARESAAKTVADAVLHLTHRMDAYITRREAQRKADAEEAEREEQQRIRWRSIATAR